MYTKNKISNKRTVFKGISWVGFFRLFSRLIALIKTAILARVFSPLQFGVFGISTLLLAFLEILTETGINIILVQSKEKIEEFVDTAWVVSIIRGIIISALIYFTAPIIAVFFNSKEAVFIIQLIAIVPLIRGFINPSENSFQKNLHFHKEFYLQSSLIGIDAVFSIIFAVLTRNVYSLVIGQIASASFEVLFTFVFIKPVPRFTIDSKKLGQIFHKGKWVTWVGIWQYIAENLDNISVGKFLGTSQLGVYQVAYRISTLTITELSDVVNRVFFPFYSKISEDRKNIKSIFLKSTLLLSSVVVPVSLIFYFFPREIILILLGSKWLGAVEVLKVLAFYGMLRAISGYSSSLFYGLGLQKYVAYMLTARGLALAISVFPLLFAFGIVGVAYSALFSVLVEIPFIVYYLNKVFQKK